MPKISLYVKLLKASKLTQKVLAKELGITPRTYSKWTNGHAVPSSERTKDALDRAFTKYGVARTPTAFPAADTNAPIEKGAQVPAVPDIDPSRLRRARKASGLTAIAFSAKLGITSVSQYYRYEAGYVARTRGIRQKLYLVCQSVPEIDPIIVSEAAQILVHDAEGETAPLARSRGRAIVSESLIKDFVERFERIALVDYEQELLRKIIRAVAQEDGDVPRKVREQTAKVLGAALGRIPLDKLYILLIGVDP